MAPAEVHSLPRTRDLFYGGRFQSPHGGYTRTSDPATQDDLGLAANADRTDVAAAVEAAQEAFDGWRTTNATHRSQLLHRFAASVRRHGQELAWLDAINGGNPLRELSKDVENAAQAIDHTAGLAHELKGETLPLGQGVLNYSLREPLGVVARIVAYNHPMMFLASKLAPAIAAGNTVVMKAPVQVPLSSYRLAEIAAEIFPVGVVNFLTGDRECGESLVAHPLVRKVSLIGSTETGVAILKAAAGKVMPVSLELGGKNPLIICADADLERAIDGAIAGMNFGWAGQSCGSTSRCFVHRSIYDEVLTQLARRIPERHRCGSPLDPATTCGSLVSQTQFEKVLSFIASAHEDGARLVCGGGPPTDPSLAKGWFIEPTVFADVTSTMRLFREEVFGPVLAVMPWDDEDALMQQVNSVEYGLTASIWTRDLDRAHRLAGRVESGYVWINHGSQHFIGAEFGGYKKSGMGREEGLSELLSFTQTKNIHVRFS